MICLSCTNGLVQTRFARWSGDGHWLNDQFELCKICMGSGIIDTNKRVGKMVSKHTIITVGKEPAFPVDKDSNYPVQRGITKRDYFAAASILSASIAVTTRSEDKNPIGWTPTHSEIAKEAYLMADAMLAESLSDL